MLLKATLRPALFDVARHMHPSDSTTISMSAYIPFARRRITRVIVPTDLPDGAMVNAKYWRLVTAPAPWTPEEKWRARRPLFQDEVHDLSVGAQGFEVETATLATEPDEIVILVEPVNLDPNSLNGMALRGRWAFVGEKGSAAGWWIHKTKDCK